MFAIRMSPLDREIGELVTRLKGLPGHIARKHIAAATGRAVRPFRSVMVKATPPAGGAKRGRRAKDQPKKSTGALRRSVKVITAKSKRNRNGGFAVMGYSAGIESRKALWLESGTKRGIAPRNIVRQVMAELGPKVRSRLPAELAISLERAAAELASGRNPGRTT